MEMQVNLSPLLRKIGGEWGGGGLGAKDRTERRARCAMAWLNKTDCWQVCSAQHLHQMLTGMWGQEEPGRCSDRNREPKMPCCCYGAGKQRPVAGTW